MCNIDNNVRTNLTKQVLDGEISPTEAGRVYAELRTLKWLVEDAAEEMTGFDACNAAEEALDNYCDNSDGLEELFDWIDENGRPVRRRGKPEMTRQPKRNRFTGKKKDENANRVDATFEALRTIDPKRLGLIICKEVRVLGIVVEPVDPIPAGTICQLAGITMTIPVRPETRDSDGLPTWGIVWDITLSDRPPWPTNIHKQIGIVEALHRRIKRVVEAYIEEVRNGLPVATDNEGESEK